MDHGPGSYAFFEMYIGLLGVECVFIFFFVDLDVIDVMA
jgi:hypothetical protein